MLPNISIQFVRFVEFYHATHTHAHTHQSIFNLIFANTRKTFIRTLKNYTHIRMHSVAVSAPINCNHSSCRTDDFRFRIAIRSRPNTFSAFLNKVPVPFSLLFFFFFLIFIHVYGTMHYSADTHTHRKHQTHKHTNTVLLSLKLVAFASIMKWKRNTYFESIESMRKKLWKKKEWNLENKTWKEKNERRIR